MYDLRFALPKVLIPFGLMVVFFSSRQTAAEEVSFRDVVLPLLSDRCFQCHGPDASARQADLRLDQPEAAQADRGGYHVILPGEPDESTIMERIAARDTSSVMPPPESGKKPLTAKEIEAIRSWITAGAPWEKHWSFVPITRPATPGTLRKAWGHNPIDTFVLRKLEDSGLKPMPEASKGVLLRRLSLALIGLPPTLEEVDTFLADPDPEAYERAVDRLLASPRYGERMAYGWLDAARYADTDGYQIDESRENWPWRDWVIRAYNENMPFDQFTLEQFAGDLLPEATQEEIVATCFHRNHLTNGEGGQDSEEARVYYVIDRVNTMGTVWLGLTLGCCQCHDHKYDPISQREYYALTAFFNSIDESGKAGRQSDPYLSYKLPTEHPAAEKIISPLQRRLDDARSGAEKLEQQAQEDFPAWLEQSWKMARATIGPATSWTALKADRLQSSVGKVRLQQRDDLSIVALPEGKTVKVDYTIAASSPVSPTHRAAA